MSRTRRGNSPIPLPSDIEPHWLPSQNVVIPYCADDCTSHDGKRCRLLGFRPPDICEPAVAALVTIATTPPEDHLMPRLMDPRPVDGRVVHPAASAWYDPADHSVFAYRLPNDPWHPWRSSSGEPCVTLVGAIRASRDESRVRNNVAATITGKSTRIRDLEAALSIAETSVAELQTRVATAERDLDSARRMVLLLQWIAVAAIVAGGSLGYALASVGGAS